VDKGIKIFIRNKKKSFFECINCWIEIIKCVNKKRLDRLILEKEGY
jgi:uncharacterized protein YifN (PemK superfamily)